MTLPRIDHVSIGTTDPDHFDTIMREVLGFKVGPAIENLIDRGTINDLFGWEGGESPVPRTTYYGREGEFRIEVVHMADTVASERNFSHPPQGMMHVGIYVENLVDILRKAEELGVDFVSGPVEFQRPNRHFQAGFFRTREVEFELLENL